MIPPQFDYAAPNSIADAVKLLGENPGAKILAGGQSLIPMMKFRLASPALLIDLNKVGGLSYIREDGGWLKIGTLTREVDLDRSDLVASKYALLADTAKVIADPIVRNWATVGGNLAHADPANDHPATMLAYGAEIVATGPGGERVIPAAEFFQDAFTTVLAHDEILTEIRIPAANGGSGGAYLKIERKVGDFATAAVAVNVKMNGGTCQSVGIGLTNVGYTPIKAAAAEAALTGQPADDAHIAEAAQAAADASQPIGDYRGSEDYKRSLVKTLTSRAIRLAVSRAQGG
jgi:carbon-monoxide dehydrogenase medium subunit